MFNPIIKHHTFADKVNELENRITRALGELNAYDPQCGTGYNFSIVDEVVRILTGSEQAYEQFLRDHRGHYDEEMEEYEYSEWGTW